MPVPSDTLGLADSTLVMLLHDMAFKWADGCPKTYYVLLQDLFSSNGIPPVIIPASLKDLRRLPSAAQRVREISAAIDLESCPVLPQNSNVPQADNSTPEITIKCELSPNEPESGYMPEEEVTPIDFPDNADNSPPCSPGPSLTSYIATQVKQSTSAGNSPIKEPGFESVRSIKRKISFPAEDGPITRSTKRRNTVPDTHDLAPGASNHFLPISTSASATSAKSPIQPEVVFYLKPDFISGINTASEVLPKKQKQNFPYIPHGGDYKKKPIRAHMFISSNNYLSLDSRILTIKDNEIDKIYLDNILVTDTLISLKKNKKTPATIVIAHKDNPNKCLGKIHAPYGLTRADKNNFVQLIFNWAKANGFTTDH